MPNTPSNARAGFKRYLRLTAAFHPRMARLGIVITLLQLIGILRPVLAIRLVQAGLGQPDLSALLGRPETLGWVGVIAAYALLNRYKTIRERQIVTDTHRELKDAAHERLMRLDGSFHERHNTTETYTKIAAGISAISDISHMLAGEFWPLVVMFVANTAICLTFSPVAALIASSAVVAYVAMTVVVLQRKSGARRSRHAFERYIDRTIASNVEFFRTVWAFGRLEAAIDHVRLILTKRGEMVTSEYETNDRLELARNLLIGGATLGVLIASLHQARHTPAQAGGNAMLAFLLAERLLLACGKIGDICQRTIESAEPLAQLEGIMEEPIVIDDPVTPVELGTVRGQIDFIDARYAYPGHSLPVLDGVNLRIAAGESVAFVGKSGAGKTTLVKALQRYFDVDTGHVRIDGVDIRDYSLRDLRRTTSVMLQDTELFDGTVAENIAYGKPGATFEEIVAAAKKAHAHDFIMSLPRGYHTPVGSRGLKLSGGQKQRVGLARVFLRDTPIVILDEATSNVGADDDAAIHLSVQALTEAGKTVIVIAHRLPTVRAVDRIVFVDAGRVVETGSPAVLAKANGPYAHLLGLYERSGAQTGTLPDGAAAN